jgi:chromosome partitioning protein
MDQAYPSVDGPSDRLAVPPNNGLEAATDRADEITAGGAAVRDVSRETPPAPPGDRPHHGATAAPDATPAPPATPAPDATPAPPATPVSSPAPDVSRATPIAPPAPAVPEPTDVWVIPEPGDDTPLAQEVANDARRRRVLHGQRLPAPARTRVLTVANQKGGVGKTTTTVNLAAALAQSGLSVLVIDIDPQGNASTALGIDHHSEVPSVYEVLVEGRPLAEVVQECPDVPGLLCAPATIDLAGAEIELVSLVARESRLLRALGAYLTERERAGQARLDYVLIDCPPSLGLLTVNAFVAAPEVMIPIQCEYYALEGLSQLLKNVELIKAHLNPDLQVSTILLTMYDARTRLAADVATQVREHFAGITLRASIPRSVRISEAPSHGQTVMTYDPGSSGALSYLEAAKELAQQAGADSESNA